MTSNKEHQACNSSAAGSTLLATTSGRRWTRFSIGSAMASRPTRS